MQKVNEAVMLKKVIFFLFLGISAFPMRSQVVYEHVSNTAIYDFLDELANNKVINLFSAVKPYSRMFIANKLREAAKKKDLLNKRQRKELDFYLQGFQTEMPYPMKFTPRWDLLRKNKKWAITLNPVGAYYKDSLVTLWLKPVLGYAYHSNKNGSYRHTYGGLEFDGYIGKHVGFYASLRDNTITKNVIQPDFFVTDQAAPVKTFAANDIEFSEARGGITFSWKWGAVGLVKDNPKWGDTYYQSNILSGRTPSYAMIVLHLKPVKWFTFDYYHGWLVSDVVDSIRSYWDGNTYRAVFRPKFMAANMFSFRPFKRFWFSFGNSIVYSDISVHAAYFIPFLFYKSVDHTLNATYHYGDAGQNSQMFFNISSRNIKHVHLYGSLFVDELSLRHMFDKETQRNQLSVKGGFRVSDFPLSNLWFGMEYTRSNPLVYQNYLDAVTFESNSYSLGHYLRDNSDVANISLGYKPIRGLHVALTYRIARHGTDYNYKELLNNGNSSGLPFMDKVIWKERAVLFSVRYEIVNNAYFYIHYRYSNITGEPDVLNKYTPEYYQGKTNTITVGANIGF
jgi:hypothetical protein